jgi:hypothetical protein
MRWKHWRWSRSSSAWASHRTWRFKPHQLWHSSKLTTYVTSSSSMVSRLYFQRTFLATSSWVRLLTSRELAASCNCYWHACCLLAVLGSLVLVHNHVCCCLLVVQKLVIVQSYLLFSCLTKLWFMTCAFWEQPVRFSSLFLTGYTIKKIQIFAISHPRIHFRRTEYSNKRKTTFMPTTTLSVLNHDYYREARYNCNNHSNHNTVTRALHKY